MILRKAKTFCLPVLCCMALALVLFQVPAKCYAFEIGIEVAPNTLNIQSQSQVVTVHTTIKFSSVAAESVYLNEIQINSWKADSRGYFVAKFLMEEVKALAETGVLDVPGENELILIGYDINGAEFTGYQTITVINVEPAGGK
jgi:hypothetical protein